jgi:hypothetical protein
MGHGFCKPVGGPSLEVVAWVQQLQALPVGLTKMLNLFNALAGLYRKSGTARMTLRLMVVADNRLQGWVARNVLSFRRGRGRWL